MLLKPYGGTKWTLPPCHPDSNPSEKIWFIMKGQAAKHNVTFKINDTTDLSEQKFTDMLEDDWKPSHPAKTKDGILWARCNY